MADVHRLSRAAFERLEAEYVDLTTRGRIDIARKIETAREPAHKRSPRGARVSRVSLFAPLRRLRRSLFGGHKH